MATTATLNRSQVLILQTLAKHGPLSTTDLSKKSGAAVNSGNLGPVFAEVLENYPDSLYGQKLVRPEQDEGGPVVWHATAAGKKAAAAVKTRKASGADKVPAAQLDAAVRKFAPTRTYGFELYTTDDLREVRGLLGSAFAEASPEDLRQQMVARRKQGAFADPKEKARRAAEAAVRNFGPGGLLGEVLTEKQAKDIMALVG